MEPIVEQLAGEVDNVEFAKVNVDDNSELAMRFNVLSIPTFIIMKGGSEVGRFSGTTSKESFKDKLAQYS